MKKITLLIISTCITFFALAQKEILTEQDGKLFVNNSLYSGIQKINKNNQLVSQYTIKDGLKDGKVTHYHSNNKTKEIGFYSNNEKDGTWEKWDDRGNKIGEAHYENGKKEGSWIVWDHKGIKRYEMFYENGKKIGTWKVWDDNGLLTQEKKF